MKSRITFIIRGRESVTYVKEETLFLEWFGKARKSAIAVKHHPVYRTGILVAGLYKETKQP